MGKKKLDIEREIDRLYRQPLPTLVAAATLNHRARGTAGFFRYKSIIGDRLRARHSNAQATEAMVACNILNRITELVGRSPTQSKTGPTR